jgi:hypothetical protein
MPEVAGLLLTLPLYVIFAVPALLFLWLVSWCLQKLPMSRGIKITLFSVLSVLLLSPFITQADIAAVIGPAYMSVLPMLVDGYGRQFVNVLMREIVFHLIGAAVIASIAAFVSYRFLFKPDNLPR